MEPISAFLAAALQNLLLSILGKLGTTFATFFVQLKKEAADDPSIEQTLATIVRRITVEHPEWAWHDKFVYASNAAMDYFGELEKDVSRAVVNTILSAQVVEQRVEGTPPDSARTLGSQP